MRQYEDLELKPSMPWFGRLPKHWNTSRIKYFFNEVDDRSQDGSEQLLSVSRYTGVTPKSADTKERVETLEGYKKCQPGDLVSNIMLAWNGSLGITNFDGVVSPAYAVYRLKKPYEPKYFHYLFRTKKYLGEFHRNSTGVVDSRLRLYTDDFFRLYSPLPPLEEQRAIVRYLDKKLGQIDTFVQNKRRLITLLEEQKSALINRAVTKGLDEGVRGFKSGDKWFKQIPEAWKLSKLSFLSRGIGDGLHSTPEYVDSSDYAFINGNNLEEGTIKISGRTNFVSEKEYQKHFIPLDKGTLLMSINGTIGKLGLYRGEKIILGKSAAYIRCKSSLDKQFLYYLLQSEPIGAYISNELTGTTISNLSLKSIRSMPITLPSLKEQKDIVRFIEGELKLTKKATAKANQEIHLINEYRTTLISEVVTGKIDVRGAA